MADEEKKEIILTPDEQKTKNDQDSVKVIEGLLAPPKADSDEVEPEDVEKPSDDKVVADDKTTVVDKDSDDKEDKEPIDQRLVDAARQYGWSDEKIIKCAEETPEILDELATLSELRANLSKTVVDEPADEPEDKEVKSLIDKELLGAIEEEERNGSSSAKAVKMLLAQNQHLVSELEKVKGGLGTLGQNEIKNRMIDNFHYANEVFDDLSEQFPAFGKVSEIPTMPDGRFVETHPAYKVRAEVYDVADRLYRTGITWRDAVNSAIAYWKGSNEEAIKESLLKDIDKQGKKALARHTSKTVKKEYASKDEESIANIQEIAKKAGVELPR